jgi:hypothetical protein
MTADDGVLSKIKEKMPWSEEMGIDFIVSAGLITRLFQ